MLFRSGQNGNSDIPAYSTIDSYMSNPNHSNYPIDGSQSSVTTGYTQTRYGNANLKWETTTQTNVGLDLGFLDNSLTVVLDWFNKDTKDLLWERPLIGTVGGTNQTVWDNVGKMRTGVSKLRSATIRASIKISGSMSPSDRKSVV